MSTYTVEIKKNGDEEVVEVSEDEVILDAAEENGLDLPYSCREGACTSCVGRVEEGQVEDEGYALDPHQVEDGYALLCVSYPRSDCEIVADAQSELFDLEL
jgi:ferredoxin